MLRLVKSAPVDTALGSGVSPIAGAVRQKRPRHTNKVALFPAAPQSAGSAPPSSYDELREAGRRAIEAGQLEDAFELLDQALTLARSESDESRADLAFCNRAAVAITLGRGDAELPGLREVLMRNADPANGFAAAYNLSHAHELDKSFKKGLFYARIAHDRAETVENAEHLAKSHNQIGNCLLAESYFDDAAAQYRKALELLDESAEIERATVRTNLGYCRMMQGKIRRGFRLSFTALRTLRRHDAPVYEAWPHLDLTYAYLEIGRPERARRHGERALALGEETGYRDVVKNALFLLGEAEQACERSDLAYEHFQRLQREFYPDSPRAASLMLAVDTRRLINLRA